MSEILFSLILLFSIVSPVAASTISPQNGEIVEGIAAVVTILSRKPIRKLVFYSDLERYRLFFASPEEKANLSHYLNQIILQHLLLPEARRFILKKPAPEAIEMRLRKIQNRFKNDIAFEAALQQTGLIEIELEKEIQEHLRVEQLLDERIKDFIFINPKTIGDYFEKHPELFSGKPLLEVSEEIEIFLVAKKEAEKKTEYLRRIKSKAKIEILFKDNLIE